MRTHRDPSGFDLGSGHHFGFITLKPPLVSHQLVRAKASGVPEREVVVAFLSQRPKTIIAMADLWAARSHHSETVIDNATVAEAAAAALAGAEARRIAMRKKGDDDVHGDDDVDSPNASDAQVTCGVETRDTLVTLVGTILHKFADRSDPGIDDRSDPSDDPNQSEPTAPSYGQLVTDVLRALTRFDDDAFRSALFSKNKETLGYDSLVTLVSSVATPTETRAALSEVFARRVGPLASRALRSEAER